MLKPTASEKKAEYCAQDENKDDNDCACYRGVTQYIELSKTAIDTYESEKNQNEIDNEAAMLQYRLDREKYDEKRIAFNKKLQDAQVTTAYGDCVCCTLNTCPCVLSGNDFNKPLVKELKLESSDLYNIGQGPTDKIPVCGCSVYCKITDAASQKRLEDWDKNNKPPNKNDYLIPFDKQLVYPEANIKCVTCKNIIKNINADSSLENVRQECNISIYEEQQGRKKKDGGEGKGKGEDGGEGKGKGEGGSGGKGAPNLSLGLIFGIVLCGLGVLLLIIGLILKFRGK